MLLLLILILLFGGFGGGWYGNRNWGTTGGFGIGLGTILMIVLIVYLFGHLR